jgi:hypothetical protein
MLFWSFLKVCPIHFHFLILISLLIGICCVVSHNSLLFIVVGQHVMNMLRRYRLTNVCSLLMLSCAVFHVSHPYNNTFITLLLNILNVVLLWIWCDAHIGLSWVKAPLALGIRFVTASMTPPSWETIQPKYRATFGAALRSTRF